MRSWLCSPGVSMAWFTQICHGKKVSLTEEGSAVKASAESDASPQGISPKVSSPGLFFENGT